MASFKELQDWVRDDCQQLMAKPDFTLTKVQSFINLGQLDFVRRTKCLEQVYAITTVADQVTYSLNDAILQIKGVRYVEDSSTEFGEVLTPYSGGFDALPKIKSFGIPIYYYTRSMRTRGSGVIGTHPIASVAGEAINVEAYYAPTDLSANGDISEIKEPWHDALVHYAVWRLTRIYAHEAKAIREKSIEAKASYYEILNSAMHELSIASDDSPQQIVDAYGDGW